MKRTLLLIAATLFVFSLNAQQARETEDPDNLLVSKNGRVILPESGDIALGFDAVPVLNFALNLVNIMNNTGHTAQHPGYVSGFNQVIVGKYFLDQNRAIRVKFGINTQTEKNIEYFDDPLSTATSNIPEIDNVFKESERTIVFGGGLEFRRGHSRLQGFYGGELLLARSAEREDNEYGIIYNQDYENANAIWGGSNRRLDFERTAFGLGLRGFVGVEYFFAPKMSISAEFGWGLGYRSQSRGSETREFWDDPNNTGSNSARIEEILGSTETSLVGFIVDDGSSSDIFGGSAALSLIFHF